MAIGSSYTEVLLSSSSSVNDSNASNASGSIEEGEVTFLGRPRLRFTGSCDDEPSSSIAELL